MNKLLTIALVPLLISFIFERSYADIVAYWNFDNGNVKDMSFYSNHGLEHFYDIPNAVSYRDGVYCKGLRLIGEGTYEGKELAPGGKIILPPLDFTGWNEISICLWVKEDSMAHHDGENYIYFGFENYDGWIGISHYPMNADRSVLRFSLSGRNEADIYTTIIPASWIKGKWVFYSMTYSNGTLEVYMNCKQLISIKNRFLASKSTGGFLGSHWWNLCGTYRNSARFIGMIDDVRIYNSYLSKDEIKDICTIKKLKFKITGKETLCIGDTLFLSSTITPINEVEYEWSGPNNFSSSEANPFFVVNENSAGTYFLKCKQGCIVGEDSINVEVVKIDKPVIIPSDTIICKNSQLILTTSIKYDNLLWSTGETKDSITVDSAGVFFVTASYKGYCPKSDTIIIEESSWKVEILPKDTKICLGDSIIIYSSNEFENYIWSTGETSRSITVREAGVYSVYATDIYGCIDSVSTNITVFNKPDIAIEFLNDAILCEGDTATLTVKVLNADEDLTFQWSTNDTSLSILVNKSGKYYVIATNNYGCQDTAEINLLFLPIPDIDIQASTDKICDGDSAVLKVNGNYRAYLWSDNTEKSELIVSEAGSYRVRVWDDNGCSVEDSVIITKIFMDNQVFDDVVFDKIPNGYNSSLNRTFTNLNDFPINIMDIYLKKNDGNFSIKTNKLIPLLIDPNDNVDINISFHPHLVTGVHFDSLIIVLNEPCYQELSVSISGESFEEKKKSKVLVSLSFIKSIPGEHLCFPLKLSIIDGDPPERISYKGKIRYEAEAYSLTTAIENIRIENYMIVNFSGTQIVENAKEYELLTLCGTTLLGSKTYYPLIIEEFEIKDTSVIVEIQNGNLELYGVCAHSLRSIINTELTKLYLYPNPVMDCLTINIISEEIGLFDLIIYSSTGSKYHTSSWSSDSKQNISHRIDVSNFNTGIYFIVLKTPWNVISSKLFIVK